MSVDAGQYCHLPMHYSVTQHPGQYCHLPITLSPSTLASTATFPLLSHPAPWPVLPPSHYSVTQLWNPLVLSRIVEGLQWWNPNAVVVFLYIFLAQNRPKTSRYDSLPESLHTSHSQTCFHWEWGLTGLFRPPPVNEVAGEWSLDHILHGKVSKWRPWKYFTYIHNSFWWNCTS